MSDDFFASPPFKAAEALAQLKRQLRELRPLADRSDGYEINGKKVVAVSLAASGDSIDAKVAKRAAVSPDWERSTIRNSAEQRKFLDAVKARLARWTDDD